MQRRDARRTASPEELSVQLYADAVQKSGLAIETMAAVEARADTPGTLIYSAEIPAARSAGDFTLRIVPHHANAAVPLEAAQILWQR
jgi:starch phosphorylase